MSKTIARFVDPKLSLEALRSRSFATELTQAFGLETKAAVSATLDIKGSVRGGDQIDVEVELRRQPECKPAEHPKARPAAGLSPQSFQSAAPQKAKVGKTRPATHAVAVKGASKAENTSKSKKSMTVAEVVNPREHTKLNTGSGKLAAKGNGEQTRHGASRLAYKTKP